MVNQSPLDYTNLTNITSSNDTDDFILEVYLEGSSDILLGTWVNTAESYTDGSNLATSGQIKVIFNITDQVSAGTTLQLVFGSITISLYISIELTENTVYYLNTFGVPFTDSALTEFVDEYDYCSDTIEFSEQNEEEIESYLAIHTQDQITFTEQAGAVNENYEMALDSISFSESVDYYIEDVLFAQDSIAINENTEFQQEQELYSTDTIQYSESVDYYIDIVYNSVEAISFSESCSFIESQIVESYLLSQDSSQAEFQDGEAIYLGKEDVFEWVENTDTINLTEKQYYYSDIALSAIDTISITEYAEIANEEYLYGTDTFNYSETASYYTEPIFAYSDTIQINDSGLIVSEIEFRQHDNITLTEVTDYFVDIIVFSHDNITISDKADYYEDIAIFAYDQIAIDDSSYYDIEISEKTEDQITFSESANYKIGLLQDSYLHNQDNDFSYYQDGVKIYLCKDNINIFDFAETSETLSITEHVNYSVEYGLAITDSINLKESPYYDNIENAFYTNDSITITDYGSRNLNELVVTDSFGIREIYRIVNERYIRTTDKIGFREIAYPETGVIANQRIRFKERYNSILTAYDIILPDITKGYVYVYTMTEEDDDYKNTPDYILELDSGADLDWMDLYIPLNEKGYQMKAKVILYGEELELDYIGTVYKMGRIK